MSDASSAAQFRLLALALAYVLNLRRDLRDASHDGSKGLLWFEWF